MIDIQIDEQYQGRVSPALILQAAEETLKQSGVQARVEISILITGNEQIRALNQQFRQVDAPTDVLSFPSGEEDLLDGTYLGDMILSFEKASAQAEKGGHTIDAEIQLLTVHGVLHLLGHDHYDADEKARMWAVQADTLRAIGCEIETPVLLDE